MAKKTAAKHVHLYYSGAVQGIGFRYAAERIAGSLQLTGWVRNLPDGRVEVLCEGAEPDIKTFLEKINDTFKGYISAIDAGWDEATGEFRGFDIKF